jgi:hypothetical protein
MLKSKLSMIAKANAIPTSPVRDRVSIEKRSCAPFVNQSQTTLGRPLDMTQARSREGGLAPAS